MTQQRVAPDAAGPPGDAPSDAASDAALSRYRSATRRHNAIYFAVLAVVLAVFAVVIAIAWSRGEVANTSLHTVRSAPPTLAPAPPSPQLELAWRSTDRAAIGSPQWNGTIVTFAKHTVAGRDARTGKPTWSYTRSNRTVCTAMQTGGTTIAVYRLHGNCDELTALDSNTGRRRWTRTLDMDGQPISGNPNYQVTSATFIVQTSYVIYAVDPVSGYNRWTYQRDDCRIEHVVIGTGGALISQDCSAKLACNGAKFCGRGPQLFLRDASAGKGDDNKPNPDQIKWNLIGNTDLPVSADQVISAVDPAGQRLSVLDVGTGHETGSATLHPQSSRLGTVTSVPTADAELVWLSGQLYAVRPNGTVAWSAASAAPPTVQPTDQNAPTLATVRITALSPSGVATLGGTDGRPGDEAVVTAPAGASAYPLGSGYLIAAPSGSTVYR